MSTSAPSDFARLRRLHERGAYDAATIHAVLDAATHCHVGHVIDGRPVVIPTLHWREGDTVYWHGSAASRMLRHNAGGGEVCLTATLIDGYVLARSGFHHSVNYRSVMCFGTARLVEATEEKTAALKGFVDRLFPGRWDTLRPPTAQELKATAVLAMPIREAAAKMRSGPPGDDPEDLTWPAWAGVLPLHIAPGAPQPDAHVTGGLLPPATPG
ncbi:MAG: pyridoxamine 5'-phosphate oxidase family protein [Rhodospirillales bacterium]|nr:pyridoxamine 5'-phosphate oxidase family protein [Rhodospirillales bacterium]